MLSRARDSPGAGAGPEPGRGRSVGGASGGAGPAGGSGSGRGHPALLALSCGWRGVQPPATRQDGAAAPCAPRGGRCEDGVVGSMDQVSGRGARLRGRKGGAEGPPKVGAPKGRGPWLPPPGGVGVQGLGSGGAGDGAV